MKLGQSIPTIPATNTGANADKAAVPADQGIIVSSALTTAAVGAALYTLTVACPAADQKGDGSSIVLASVGNGSNSAGMPVIVGIQITMGQVVFQVANLAPAAALNGTIKVSFVVLN